MSHLLLDGDVPSAFAYPDEEPWMTLPLSGLTPYQPQKTTLTRHSMDCDQRGAGFIIDGTDGGEYSIRIYRSTDGNVYAAVMQSEAAGRDGMSEWEADVFFTFPNNVDVSNDAERTDLFFFEDLMGYSGFTVTYRDYLSGGPGQGGQIGEVTDYYYLDGDGVPCLLAHAKGDAQLIDLDGDGINELCAASGASGQIFFQRDSRYYEADVKALLQNAWPEMNYWDHASWDLNYRRLAVSGFVTMPEWATAEFPQPDASFTRYLYYRDGALLVYKPDKDSQTADHVVGTPDVPEPVLAAAKATVQKAYQDYKNGGFDSGADLDNWRVEYVAEDWYRAYPNGTLIAYNLNYEYHAQKPANVTLAGGAYVDEDGWLMPDYPYCHYLLFAEKDGQYTFLKEQMINDGGPGTPFFEAEMLWLAADAGLTSLTDSTDDQLLEQLYDGKGGRFLSQMGELSTEEQTAIYRRLREYQQTCGDSQAQSLYIEAVQTMQWVRNFYDDAQRAAYELFLAESVRGDEAAAAAQEIMDAMTAEGTITLEYQNNGKRSTRTLDPAGEPTPARAAAFSGSFFWTETQPVEIGNLPEPELTLTSRNGDVIITVWNSAPQVYCVYQGETRAFLAASTSADSFDGNQPFTYLRKWYDKAE